MPVEPPQHLSELCPIHLAQNKINERDGYCAAEKKLKLVHPDPWKFVSSRIKYPRLKIDPLPLHHQRTVQNLGMNRPDVFAKDADEEKLDRGKQKEADHDGSDPDGKMVPEQQLINKIP